MAEEAQTLRGSWLQAEKQRQSVESLPTTDANAQVTLNSAIAAYERCIEIANRISLFSSNESLDDLSSSSLP